MGFKRLFSYLGRILLVPMMVISTAGTAAAIGLSDDYPRLDDAWQPRAYKAGQSIDAYLNGYTFSEMPGRSYLLTDHDMFLPFSDRLFALDSEGTDSGRPGLMAQITSDSGSILAMAVGTIAFLYVMPESFSKWPQDKKDLSPNKLWERYDKNVSNGPVWDKDEWEVNYIGHPYFGAAYYTHAINKDFTRLEALSYSFMMSTCLYEYGLEAFFEDPSIQDIIVTPLAGALFGEAFITMAERIRDNGDTVLGSKTLGTLCLFMMDPISVTLVPINRFNERYSKLRMNADYYARSTISDDASDAGVFYDHRVGVNISITTDAFSR
ncbi:hypothetical protein JCM14469_42110 [Desulfatiferula olefinivorans]